MFGLIPPVLIIDEMLLNLVLIEYLGGVTSEVSVSIGLLLVAHTLLLRSSDTCIWPIVPWILRELNGIELLFSCKLLIDSYLHGMKQQS